MTLADYQMEFQALVLGPGTDYIITEWTGLGTPEYRTSDDRIPLDHGVWTGPEYLEGRSVTLRTVVRGDSEALVTQNADALLQAWYLDTRDDGYGTNEPLKVKLPGRDERWLFGRPRRVMMETSGIKGTNIPSSLEFFASDPRWYSATEHSTSIAYNSAASGRAYDRAYDYGYGGAGQSNAVQILNAGSFPTRPHVRIDGPVTNPYIINETAGKTLQLTYTLPAGEYLDVDFADRTVMLNGTASRYYVKSGDWFELAPGNNDIRFGVGSTSGAPTAVMTWRDAWL